MTCTAGDQSSASIVQSLQQELSALQKKLSQKKSFEQSVKEASSLVQGAAADGTVASVLPSIEEFFKRARTLLRSRYTNAAFWATTEETARACQVGKRA